MKTDKAREWLKSCKDYHKLAQITTATFRAIIYMITNLKLRPSTLKLFNFLLSDVIGPWYIFRLSIRLGDVPGMLRVFYSYFLNLAVTSNAYNYTHITINDFVETANLQTRSQAGSQMDTDILKRKNLAYTMKLSDYSQTDSTGQSLDLRLEEQFRRGLRLQHAKMSTAEAFRSIDLSDILTGDGQNLIFEKSCPGCSRVQKPFILTENVYFDSRIRRS